MRYKSKRDYYWSPQIAYSVGLMASDGCLQSDGRHLDLTSKDIEQLECFKKATEIETNITQKFNSTGMKAHRVQFGNVAYYDFLIGIGLTPRKSKTLAILNIPDDYYSHFLRGVFDGDGTCYAYNDPRWPNSFLFYVGFAGASIEFLRYLSDMNQRLFGVKGCSIRKSSRASSLVYGKSDGLILYLNMYKEAGDFFLKRKREKLEAFIKTNGNDIIR